ncbi:MAG: substrate-binding domain-containing protein, partial [Planctomycetota bacterium]
DGVVVDGFNQGRIAMQHLLEMGHRRIGLVDTTADAPTYDDIREGMQAVLADAGMSWEDLERVSLSEADLDPEEPWANGERGASKLLAEHDNLTALLGINPHITLGCYRAVRATGRRVGHDVSVLAIGSDLPTFALLQPSISVVDSPMEQIGERAAMRLRKLINSDGGRSRITEMPPTLIRRDSVQEISH